MLGHEPTMGEPGRLRLRGDLTDLVAKFRQLPKRQLVVLGEPGADKTVLAAYNGATEGASALRSQQAALPQKALQWD